MKKDEVYISKKNQYLFNYVKGDVLAFLQGKEYIIREDLLEGYYFIDETRGRHFIFNKILGKNFIKKNNMENYFMIDGEKVPMSDETAKNLRGNHRPTHPSFVDDPEKYFNPRVFGGDMSNVCEIGQAAVKPEYRGRCLLLNEEFDWEIIEKPFPIDSDSKLLIAKRKD